MLRAVLLVVMVISSCCVTLSFSQSCGSPQCSKAYGKSCNDDMSCHIYDNCKTSHSKCNKKTRTAPKLKFECYDTCIKGTPFSPSVPSQCCANSLLSETIDHSRGSNYLIARIYAPNTPGKGTYRQNTFCKYNVQCPNSNYVLEYFVVDFDVEPPNGNGQCLDFLRYHFTATGAAVSADACGSKGGLSSLLRSGTHGSGLTLDFRSNRVVTGGSVFLSLSCTLPETSRARRDENSCTPSVTQQNRIVSNPYNPPLPEDYLDDVFQNEEDMSDDLQQVTVTRKGVVKYKGSTVTVKENKRTVRRFRNIGNFHVYNEIEGFLSFKKNANPRNRDFPGYGFLQVGRGFAQYIQTISDPTFLANDDEEDIVGMMYSELFNRRVFEDERFYFRPPEEEDDDDVSVDCDIEDLAELNSRSCTPLVRATANFFLERSVALGFCKNRK